MSNKFNIRANKTNSVNSVNQDMGVRVDLQSTSQPLSVLDVRSTVDQYEQFLAERDACDKHRLIVTIMPFCTNILFNPITEIVKDEGSDSPDVRTDKSNTLINDTIGKNNPNRADMVANTEYSRPEIGYVYHPGYDIFDNHILRNKSFKVVNPLKGATNEGQFNTLWDMLRTPAGDPITETIRVALKTPTVERNKHLYINDDIMSYVESVESNLMEDNGWFGFINASNVDAWKVTGDGEHTTLGVGKLDNSKLRCEFIDMYPDRTLFSFIPKYNKFRKRNERNWDMFITYPADQDSEHELVKNGLLIADIKKINNFRGHDVLMVRTYTKHNLKSNDELFFYYSSDGLNYTRSAVTTTVFGVGNTKGEQEGYFFYTTDMNLIGEILPNEDLEKTPDSVIDKKLHDMSFTMRHVYNGRESEYYIRKFKKLPNTIGENNTDFDKEYYKLAFANSIYNDGVVQSTFTDSIITDGLVDNLGRPISEIYVTIVKRNRGFENWYYHQAYGGEDIEFSHCFGPVTDGFRFDMDKDYSTDNWVDKRKRYNDITVTHPDVNSKPGTDDVYPNLSTDKIDEFVGDIVEFIPYDVREVVLNIAYHRFNTYQRDYAYGAMVLKEDGTVKKEGWVYHEIASDDFDKAGFKISEMEVDLYQRPEGYYYQPHYRIPIKSFGSIQQASHFEMRVKEVRPQSTAQGMMVRVTTRLPHRLAPNDIVYVCDPSTPERENWVAVPVVEVVGSNTFLFSPFAEGMDKLTGYNWVRLCDILSADHEDKRYKLYRKNTNIPDYALQAGRNRFLWREVLRIGNMDAAGLPEYPFANGHFYIHRPINFFLRRQDPHGYNRLYARDAFPNDVFGNTLSLGNYEYKDEAQMLC